MFRFVVAMLLVFLQCCCCCNDVVVVTLLRCFDVDENCFVVAAGKMPVVDMARQPDSRNSQSLENYERSIRHSVILLVDTTINLTYIHIYIHEYINFRSKIRIKFSKSANQEFQRW